MKTQQHILHVAKITRICALQETQSIGIHDILNAQGFAMHFRAIMCDNPLQQNQRMD